MGDQMNKAYQSNMKQLKRESKRQSYMQKDRDEQILKRLETIEKAVGQMNGYLARLTSYVDACTQDSKEAILQALREHDKKTDKTGLQNREVLKLLLSNSLMDASHGIGMDRPDRYASAGRPENRHLALDNDVSGHLFSSQQMAAGSPGGQAASFHSASTKGSNGHPQPNKPVPESVSGRRPIAGQMASGQSAATGQPADSRTANTETTARRNTANMAAANSRNTVNMTAANSRNTANMASSGQAANSRNTANMASSGQAANSRNTANMASLSQAANSRTASNAVSAGQSGNGRAAASGHVMPNASPTQPSAVNRNSASPVLTEQSAVSRLSGKRQPTAAEVSGKRQTASEAAPASRTASKSASSSQTTSRSSASRNASASKPAEKRRQ